MGCMTSNLLFPPRASRAQDTPQLAYQSTVSVDVVDHEEQPSDALVREISEVEQVTNSRDERDQKGSTGLENSPLKLLMQHVLLDNQQPDDGTSSSLLSDVSYSMRGSQFVSRTSVDELTNVVTPIRKSSGLQTPHRQRSSVCGAPIPAIVPPQQSPLARTFGLVSDPPLRRREAPVPTGYRAPQVLGASVPRGSLQSTREREHPVPTLLSSDQSETNGDQDSSSILNVESRSSEDSDDQDINEEDEEVKDWELDEEDGNVTLKSITTFRSIPPSLNDEGVSQTQHTNPARPQLDALQAHGCLVSLGSPLQKAASISPVAARSRQSSSSFHPKISSALELTDDVDALVSDGSKESDDDDEESDEYAHDWLDDPTDPPPNVYPSKRSMKLVTPLNLAPEAPQVRSGASSPPNSRHLYGLTIMSPIHGNSPLHKFAGPTAPLPPRRAPPPLSYRHGNVSPPKNAGVNLHVMIGSTSPTKQSSYRSGIVNNIAPAVVPLIMGSDQSPSKCASLPNTPPAAGAIRDTKVVKKQKAELPQHNLPHPVPKFGDWLNSRTMINNYIILETLGTGGYAEVKLCKEKLSGKLFAMKFISRDVMKRDKLGKQSKLDDIKREIEIMKKLNHPNVLRLYEVMDDPKMNKLFLVLEFMKHGDMLSFLKKKNPQRMLENLRDRDLHSVFLQVLLGLAYLHGQKIVHGDIKPQNLLVGENDVVKIADFGISQSLYGSKQKITDVAGTPAFMSPEMCTGEEYSGQLADVWALGATVFMLKFGNPPFVAKSAIQMFERIQNDPLVFPSAVDPLLAHLLDGMLTKAPLKRLTLLDVMVHPWITKNERCNFALEATCYPSRPTTVTNHMARVVNIHKQMRKRLKRARDVLAANANECTSEWVNSKVIFAQSPSGKNAGKTKKVFADFVPSARNVRAFDEHKVLSNEEIDYRSQLFSRMKASNKGTFEAPLVSSSDDFSKAKDQHTVNMNDTLEDDDILSDEEDEVAVSQSPQLLDELLLTTLSMPPLTSKLSALTDTRATKIEARSNSSFITRFYDESPHLGVRYGVSSVEGRRHTQEDRWVVFSSIASILDTFNDSVGSWAAETAYVGIYDGHGGEECANILHEQLHSWIFRSREVPSLAAKDLQDCFESLDASVCDYLLHKDDLSGSTATGLILRRGMNGAIRLTIAHVGDCRLVLAKHDGKTIELTQDHRLTLEAERERILQLGGHVVNNRVNGVMAITRAFGDLEFKGRLNPRHDYSGSGRVGRTLYNNEHVPPLLTAKPDIHDLELNPNEDAFLLLACDGLWDVLTSVEATAIFRERMELHGDLQLAAHELAQEGLRRYSNDNITVIAILLYHR